MHRSKHNVYKSRLLAIVFLFLNAVCIASPVMKNTADEYQSVITPQFGHDSISFELENQLPKSSLTSRFFSRSPVKLKNHIRAENFYCFSTAFSVQKYPNSSIDSSATLQKPGYYASLFRYTLF
ncbi:MAG: hypothetical protein ABI297_01730 [Ginsengibacter sp.]